MTQWGLDALFNPAKRHMDDEKLRLQSTREEVGDNSGGKRIDLESGKVVIHRVDAADDADAVDGAHGDDAQQAAHDGDAAPAAKSAADNSPADDDLTPAQRRARERRKRVGR